MSDYLNQFLFGYYPYICVSVFGVGCMIRYDKDQYSWKAGSSQILSDHWFRFANNMFHIGLLLLLCGHLFGLLTPESIYHKFISVEHKQLTAMIAGGIFGSICFVGLTILVFRRLFNERVRAVSSFSDTMIVILLYIQLILGLISISVSAQHLDGSSMVALANWAQHIVTLRDGAANFVKPENIIFKLHITLGLTIFLLFPFSRLVHVLSAPVKYLFRPGYQIVRSRSARK